MRHIFPLTVLTISLLSATLNAQAPCPAKVIKDCPDAGCAGWDKQLNIKKNVKSAPQQIPRQMTLQEIMQLDYPAQWYSGKDRRELEALGEGRLVQVMAYLVDVRDGQATSANCKLSDPDSTNNILTLVSQDSLGKKLNRAAPSVAAEITPRVRLLHWRSESNKQTNKRTNNWTKRKLEALISRAYKHAPYVRITGLLLLDTENGSEHNKNPVVRYTDWEIHPVFEIAVCARGTQCKEEGDWKRLDDLKIDVQQQRRTATAKEGRIKPKG